MSTYVHKSRRAREWGLTEGEKRRRRAAEAAEQRMSATAWRVWSQGLDPENWVAGYKNPPTEESATVSPAKVEAAPSETLEPLFLPEPLLRKMAIEAGMEYPE